MIESPWSLFPFPTFADGKFVDGSLLEVHPDCRSCVSRPCLADARAIIGESKTCKFGLSYARVDEDRFVLGVVSSGTENLSAGARRRNRNEPDRRVKPRDLSRAIEAARNLGPGVVSDFVASRKLAIEEMKKDPDLQKAIADQFRGDYENSLNQSHDFLQLVNLIRGNAENLLHAEYPELSPEDAADKMPEVGAIYYSTILMRMKMDSLLYLHEINRVHGGERRFEIHPFVLKYVRIYNWQAKQKNLKIALIGNCHSKVSYNSDAIGSVVQGLLDNMVKYSPPGSTASIIFEESSNDVTVKFISLGPQIDVDETSQIFMPKYRARAARLAESEGQGIGLAAVKQVSDALTLKVAVTQVSIEDDKYKSRFSTEFSVTFRALA